MAYRVQAERLAAKEQAVVHEVKLHAVRAKFAAYERRINHMKWLMVARKPALPSRSGTIYRADKIKVTAYCSCHRCCGAGASGRTASGKRVKMGMSAAPRHIPFGTHLFVPGYGDTVVEDRGGDIQGNRIDVYFDSHLEARQWGVRYFDKSAITGWIHG